MGAATGQSFTVVGVALSARACSPWRRSPFVTQRGATFVDRGSDVTAAVRAATTRGADAVFDPASLGAAALPAIRDSGRDCGVIAPLAPPSERGIAVSTVGVHSDPDALIRLVELADLAFLTLRSTRPTASRTPVRPSTAPSPLARAAPPSSCRDLRPSGQLRAYVQSNLDYMRDNPQRMAAVAAVLTGGGLSEDLPGVDHEAADRSIIETVAGILRNGQAVGEFREFDAVVAARAIRNMIDGVAAQLSRDRALDVDHQTREILGFIFAATSIGDGNEGLPS